MRRVHWRTDSAKQRIIFIAGQLKKVFLKLFESGIVHDHKVEHLFEFFWAFGFVNEGLQVLTGLIGDLLHENATQDGHREFLGGAFVEVVIAWDTHHFCG